MIIKNAIRCNIWGIHGAVLFVNVPILELSLSTDTLFFVYSGAVFERRNDLIKAAL